MANLLWVLLLAAAAAVALAPRWGLVTRYRLWRQQRRRRQLEDALKHLLNLSQRGQSGSPESLAGALALTRNDIVDLITRMEMRQLIHSTAGAIELTPDGERWALQIVRAHRLWERYLADETGMDLARVHGVAERAEHRLSQESLDVLEAHLGHPTHDPHGDPIPRADGSLEDLEAVSLTDWESAGKAHIVHIEDEPEIILRQILALGLKPGDPIRVLEREPDHIVVAHQGYEHRLAPVVAANIQVRAAPLTPARPHDATALADLPGGREADVVAIDSQFRGFARRRLLDMGLTPGARVAVALENAFGDPRAYRIRGTLVALRRDQARFVWVRPVTEEASRTPSGEPETSVA